VQGSDLTKSTDLAGVLLENPHYRSSYLVDFQQDWYLSLLFGSAGFTTLMISGVADKVEMRRFVGRNQAASSRGKVVVEGPSMTAVSDRRA